MKSVNFNTFREKGMSFDIEDKKYNIKFIPYPIEKEIYSNMTRFSELFANIFAIKDEDIEKIRDWLKEILSHEQNGNTDIDFFFKNIGVTELVVCMASLVGFITQRITAMNEMFSDGEEKKKEVIQDEQSTT